ncbi:MAG: hypothetical protein OEV28_13380 [Nitrospirota bacterium]|nr:hypothetical protein [Nitrospirota bacterium]
MKKNLVISLAAAFLLPMTVSAASIETTGAVMFDGDVYLAQQEVEKDYVRTAEFIKGDESGDSWTRVIAIRHHPRLMSPMTAAEKFGKKLQEENPGLTYEVTPCNGGKEALIQFTLPTGNSGSVFNAYRFMKQEGYAGLVSYQFSSRVPAFSVAKVGLSSPDRQKWVNELISANFDYRIGNPAQRTMASNR